MPTKICMRCGFEKPIEDFPYKSFIRQTRQTVCKRCTADKSAKWYEENKEHHLQNVSVNRAERRQMAREFVWDYLSTHPCAECGQSNPHALEFHHVGKKRTEVSKLVNEGASENILRAEIAECIVLCANCHRILTGKQQGWWKG